MKFSKKEVFTGTANYYSKYRVKYPEELVKSIVNFYEIDKTSRLLDLGCGPGQLTIPLSKYFKELIGTDINKDMIEEAKSIALEENVHNVDFKVLESEKIGNELGKFDLITCGSAFHWMDREIVLKRSYEILNESGGMVIIGTGSVWTGNQIWQKETKKVIQKWLGEKRRAGKNNCLSEVKPKTHEEYIKESEFKLVKEDSYKFIHEWDINSLIGYLYSTSFCKRELLGKNVEVFEEDLKKTLLKLNPEGIFEEEVEIGYFLLKK